MIAYTVSHIPKWNPINICSYHLQEAGATPVQEIAYAMSTAIAVLDAVRDSGQVPQERMGDVVGRISFFVNAGVRFVEEMCKMRAFGRIWDTVTRERYGIENPKHRRFRYGVQVNSLGLTEAQPENNVQRIVLEMLAVTLSKDARARAVQLPAWNEALGLPRPWDQQWSLRIQQVLAYESDLLEYEDIFEGSKVIEAKVGELVAEATAEIERIQEMGGAMAAVESGYLKSQLVSSHAARRARIESGEEKIIGVNAFEGTEPNPLTADLDTAIQTVDPAVEARVIASLQNWRDTRYQPPFNHPRPCKALEKLKEAARGTDNLMEATLECARAGVTTGEWAARCARCSASSGRRPGSPRPPWRSPPRRARPCRRSAGRWNSRRRTWASASCASWSASRAWTVTPTAPSRSPCGPATPGSRWSTRASGSPRSRSWTPRWRRTSTRWACRSSPDRTPSWCRTCSNGSVWPAPRTFP